MRKFLQIFFTLSALFFFRDGFAQTDNIEKTPPLSSVQDSSLKLYINNIIITGNKKTKFYIIEREIPFKKGDSIITSKLYSQLEEARRLIYNINLFTEVKVQAIIITANAIDVKVDVKERWYIFPTPQFKWVDRNFNDWVKTYKASLKRVNYGIKFLHYNLTGRKDQLRVFLLNGYSRNISFSYIAPYSNKALTEGFVIGAGFTQNREMAYKTSYDNKLLFYPQDALKKLNGDFVSNNFNINAGYTIRKGYYVRHIFSAAYIHQKISDSILLPTYNPTYFYRQKSSLSYIDIGYAYQYQDVNNVNYATKGRATFIALTKRGVGFSGGINMLALEAGYSKYFDLSKKWYSSVGIAGKIKIPFKQAFINRRGLGYGDSYLRGLEYYVIDGVATIYVRPTIKKQIANFKIPLPFKSKSHPYIPFTIFAKTYADAGYVYSQKQFETKLSNRLLYTGGFGIDILTLYDVNLRIEYSFNQLGEKGLFLHTQNGF